MSSTRNHAIIWEKVTQDAPSQVVRSLTLCVAVFGWCVSACDLQADEVVLRIMQPAADGIVVGHVDLTPALKLCGISSPDWRQMQARTADDGEVSLQFVPDEGFEATSRFAGLVLMRLPRPDISFVRLSFSAPAQQAGPLPETVRVGPIAVRLATGQGKGFPQEIVFPSGKTFRISRWADRVHDPQWGSLLVTDDPEATVQLVSEGPIASVVRIRARYGAGKNPPPPGNPVAVYDWVYFHDKPLIFVRMEASQQDGHAWSEHHFLELQFTRPQMPQWMIGDPPEQGTLGEGERVHRGGRWGLINDGENAVAILAAGAVLVYDAPGDAGNYLQAQGDRAWQGWKTKSISKSALIWLGSTADAVSEIQKLSQAWARPARLVATTQRLQTAIAQWRASYQQATNQADKIWWQVFGEELEQTGRLEEALAVMEARLPQSWTVLQSGDLGVVLEKKEGGLVLAGICDISSGRMLATGENTPFFEITLQRASESAADGQETRTLTAKEGWRELEVASPEPLHLIWKSPQIPEGEGLEVHIRAENRPESSALEWAITVAQVPQAWSVRQVVFPQLAVRETGSNFRVLYPQGSGIVSKDPLGERLSYSGRYPSGWTTMQFLAAYAEGENTGLYLAIHDPWASTKEIVVQALEHTQSVRLRFENWCADMGRAGNGYALSGKAVCQLLRGDWYDASCIYRDWVMRETKWYPHLGEMGREDTPLWMRELPLWALYGGPTQDCAPQVQRFASFFGVPCGVHWYNWHMIPFDNDYPHYFPTKPEFPEGVRQLREAGIHVMPYINGRLWDTRDKGLEDWQFTQRALPAASKDEKGEPFVETYGSKESDGSSVRLAVMCPTTHLWQTTVREIVLRLFQEFNVDAVYIDQIAAAAPTLCSDSSHGHPLGGGHWWVEGYWNMLEALRQQMPANCMITTECNGEPYIRWMDGYLTWHWQYDGQVPAFPAIYGGAIQMFGRSYGGGPTRDLALRMRAAQQLVFGEQLGWIAPGVVDEKDNAAFIKRLAELRWQYRQYFFAGRMLRPPRLATPVPSVTADWQWGGTRWVTTDSVLVGSWCRIKDSHVLLLAVNVGDTPQSVVLYVDLSEVKWSGKLPTIAADRDTPPCQVTAIPGGVKAAFDIPARAAFAWELAPAP